MMNILHILMNDPDEPTGGLGVAVKGITEAQKKIGITPYILGYNDYNLSGRTTESTAIADLTGEAPHDTTDMWYQQHVWQSMIMALVANFKDKEIHIIHLHDSWLLPVAEVAKAMFGCEIVYTNHLSFMLENWGWKGWNSKSSEEARLEAKCLTKCHNTFVSLPYAQKIIKQYSLDWLIPNKPSAVIHNGVLPLDETENVKLEGKNIYFCGRAVPSKGIELVIDAAAALPDWNFHLFAGASNEHKSLDSTLRLLESAEILLPNVKWYISHTQPQKCAYLRACDIALVPSTNEAPFEITGLEAMLARTPLITTASCGMRDYCNDGNCTIIEPTSDSLISSIKAHRRDEKKIQLAYETAKSFSWERAALKYKTFYEGIYAADLCAKRAA